MNNFLCAENCYSYWVPKAEFQFFRDFLTSWRGTVCRGGDCEGLEDDLGLWPELVDCRRGVLPGPATAASVAESGELAAAAAAIVVWNLGPFRVVSAPLLRSRLAAGRNGFA